MIAGCGGVGMRIQANHAGVDDALMLDMNGFVSETNATNFFIVRDGVLITPHADACLPGITRQARGCRTTSVRLILGEWVVGRAGSCRRRLRSRSVRLKAGNCHVGARKRKRQGVARDL